MADSKLTALGAASTLAGADIVYMSQGGVSVKATMTQVATFANGVGPFNTAQNPADVASSVSYGMRDYAGCFMPAVKGDNFAERLLRPLEGNVRISTITGNSGQSTISFGTSHWIGAGITSTGATGWSTANTNYITRQCATQFSGSAAAGNYGGFYNSASTATQIYMGDGSGLGGFLFMIRFIPCDTITGALMFVGLSSSNSAPTNAAPDSLTNVIGVGKLAGSTNLHILFGGSAAQTAIDLGANFPANGVKTNMYELALFSDANDNGSVKYRVTRNPNGSPQGSYPTHVATGTLTNTTPGTTLPASTTALGPRAYRHNDATATAAVIAISAGFVISDN